MANIRDEICNNCDDYNWCTKLDQEGCIFFSGDLEKIGKLIKDNHIDFDILYEELKLLLHLHENGIDFELIVNTLKRNTNIHRILEEKENDSIK